jgi:hypothetical protein
MTNAEIVKQLPLEDMETDAFLFNDTTYVVYRDGVKDRTYWRLWTARKRAENLQAQGYRVRLVHLVAADAPPDPLARY